MPPNPSDDKELTPPSRIKRLLGPIQRFSYLISIVIGFVIPIVGLFRVLWKHIPKKSFFTAFVITSVLGCSWSACVSYHNWWEFGKDYIVGLRVLPYLPLEESIFNPLGGVMSVLLYLWFTKKWGTKTSAPLHWAFILTGTAVFAVIAVIMRDTKPYYLYSQFVLFNFACSIFLAPFIAKEINLIGLFSTVLLLSVVGFAWDTVGFKYGWWTYYAVTGLKIGYVNIEDVNFFLFAPTGAISIYLLVCRIFKTPALTAND